MKKTISTIVLFLLIHLLVQAQDLFEGSIRWSVKMAYVDPAQAEKVKQIIAEFNSPEGIKKMKAIEEKMKDPVFLSYLEGNPTMKAQIEQGLSTMKVVQQYPNEDPLTLMIPKAITLWIKSPRYLLQLEGGVSSLIGNLLSDSAGKRYLIMADEKKYSQAPPYKDTTVLKSTVIATKETEKILNYTCKKYIVETELNGKKIKQQVWTTKEVKSFNTSLLADLNIGNSTTGIDFTKLEGIPLKMIITNEETIMTLTATDLKNTKVESSLFVIPKDFKEVPFVKVGK